LEPVALEGALGGSSRVLTFMFTDIEGSTKLWESDPEAMRAALARHDEIVREAIESCGGRVVKSLGDGFCACFESPPDGARAMAAAQAALQREPWPERAAVRVRMALHTGPAEERDGDFYGPTLNRAARLTAAAHGAQSLVSEQTRALLAESLGQEVSFLDLGLHAFKGLPKPERVFQLTVPGARSEFPPLRSEEGPETVSNLPVPVSAFIGRRKELAEVQSLLRSNRLVTLIGSGGCGKTRLAVQAATDLLGQFQDGAVFIDLAQVGDPSLAAAQAALALGVREEPGQEILQAVAVRLARKSRLLVIDNCEHVLSGCAPLVEALLRACPHIKVLATSREPLNIPAETTYRVPSLGVPDPRRSQTLEELEEMESVKLFLDRARHHSPGFRVGQEDCAALASVCHKLDGIPLAIELAAARIRSMSLGQVAARLDDRFRLLTGGSRTAVPRQQTLRAMVDWSYGLLNGLEQAVLRRLSVFAGGWTLEAAEKVVSGGEVDELDVLDVLCSLVDKSLVNFEPGQGSGRYRILETTRSYAAERLDETGERPATVARHLAWFSELARDSGAWARGPHRQHWLERLEPEQDNLWLALETSKEGSDAGATARLAWTLGRLFEHRGFLNQAVHAVETGLRALEARPWEEPGLRARLLYERAGLHQDFGETEQAASLAMEALTLFESLDDRTGLALTENLLGQAAMDQRDFVGAESRFVKALGLFEQTGDRLSQAIVLNNLGVLARREPAAGPQDRARRLERARTFLLEALEIRRHLGDSLGEAETTNNLGVVAFERGDHVEAWNRYGEALRIELSLDRRTGIGTTLANLGEVAEILGEPHLAARTLSLAVRVLEEVGSPLANAARSMRAEVVSKLTPGEAEEAERRVAGARTDALIEAVLARDFSGPTRGGR
jgi:predicted ATPase/class 3 adenylate cyclase